MTSTQEVIALLKHKLAVMLIGLGFRLLAPSVKDEVIRLLGIAGREHLI